MSEPMSRRQRLKELADTGRLRDALSRLLSNTPANPPPAVGSIGQEPTRVEEIRERMQRLGTMFIHDSREGYSVVPGQEEAASWIADAAWTLLGAYDTLTAKLAEAERENERFRENLRQERIEHAAKHERLEHAEQRVAGLEATLREISLNCDLPSKLVLSYIKSLVQLALTPPQPCGVCGCTLPKTHGDEPHSWEHPYHDAPQPLSANPDTTRTIRNLLDQEQERSP